MLSGVAELRKVIGEAKERRKLHNQKTILFVDEVHRWNKAQQDALLPHVEDGTFVLIGATTENPYFEVIGALVSRSRIFQLKPLGDDDVRRMLLRAVGDPERGYGKLDVLLDDDALAHLISVAGGDARNALNALELAVETTPPDAQGVVHVTLAVAQESIQRRAVLYDKDGDAHYDTISAFIKSVRGSDPDAALYWLAKMLYAGESPRFILRRLLILAGEDIGLADPLGLVVANAAAQAFEFVGLPEGVYPIVEATLYLATAPKSNSASAYFKAVRQGRRRGQGAGAPAPARRQPRRQATWATARATSTRTTQPGHHVGPAIPAHGRCSALTSIPLRSEGYEAQVTDRLARWRAAQEKALGIEQTETLPELSEAEVLDIKRRTVRRGDGT